MKSQKSDNFHDRTAPHHQELKKFLEGEEVNEEKLRKIKEKSNDDRIKDLCRILLKTKGKKLKQLAGSEGNLDNLLKERNRRFLAKKLGKEILFK